MKTRITILLVLILLVPEFILSARNFQDLKVFEKEFNKILFNLDSLIVNSENQNDVVKQHFNFVKSKLLNNELSIVYDSTLNYDFFGCSSFNVSIDNNQDVKLSFGSYVIDKYMAYPFLIYAIVIHTFQYAYDYYNNQDLFLIGLNNPIEKTYFEMDAITLEAIFLNTYVKDKKSLGYVEKYLIVDLKNNMKGSATLFKKTDIELLHTIDNLKAQDKSSDKLLKDYDKIGKDLLKSTNFDNKSDWEKYCLMVTLKTYVYYSRQVIFDIVHLKDGIESNSFKFEDYTDNLQTINEIQSVVKEHNELFSYHNETLELYGKYYK